MSTAEQLHLRALRLLHDGRPHDPEAVRWARVMASPESRRPPDHQPALNWQALRSAGFTLREISLGAQ